MIIQEKCYRCYWAGIKFDEYKLCFKPYCTNPKHLKTLHKVDMEKWNCNLAIRQQKWEEHEENKRGEL